MFYGTETSLEFDDELDKDKPLPPVNHQDVSQDNTAIGARHNVMDTEGGPWTGSQQVERVSHPEVQRPTTENQTSGCSNIDTGNGRCLGGCLILLLLAYLLGGASPGNLATSWQNFISVGNESDLETMSCQRMACLGASLPIERSSRQTVSCSWWRLRPIDIFIWIRSREIVIVYRRSYFEFEQLCAICDPTLTNARAGRQCRACRRAVLPHRDVSLFTPEGGTPRMSLKLSRNVCLVVISSCDDDVHRCRSRDRIGPIECRVWETIYVLEELFRETREKSWDYNRWRDWVRGKIDSNVYDSICFFWICKRRILIFFADELFKMDILRL